MCNESLRSFLPVSYELTARGILKKIVKQNLRADLAGASDQIVDRIATAITAANKLRHNVGDIVVVAFSKKKGLMESPLNLRKLSTSLYRDGKLISEFNPL